MERFGDMAFANVLSAFCSLMQLVCGLWKEKNFRKYISGTFIKECPAY